MNAIECCRVTEGSEWLYTPSKPDGCQGARYRVERFVLAVPAYQQQILVRALTGPDRGLWFVCSPANFASRYEPAPVPVEGQGDESPEGGAE